MATEQDEPRAPEVDGEVPAGGIIPGQNDGEIDVEDFNLGVGLLMDKKDRLHRFVTKLVEEDQLRFRFRKKVRAAQENINRENKARHLVYNVSQSQPELDELEKLYSLESAHLESIGETEPSTSFIKRNQTLAAKYKDYRGQRQQIFALINQRN